ncbi:hypothetical protein RBB82_23370 (plasmid) [Tunturiibacter lichenicola]|jgi:hypothetical protein
MRRFTLGEKEHAGATASGNGDEEVAGNDFAAISQFSLCNGLAGTFQSMRQVEQDAVHLRIPLQDFGKDSPVASADVDKLVPMEKSYASKTTLR